jgi:hypothetical protein
VPGDGLRIEAGAMRDTLYDSRDGAVVERVGATWPCLSTPRKIGPSVIFEASSHAARARTGHSAGFDA